MINSISPRFLDRIIDAQRPFMPLMPEKRNEVRKIISAIRENLMFQVADYHGPSFFPYGHEVSPVEQEFNRGSRSFAVQCLANSGGIAEIYVGKDTETKRYFVIKRLNDKYRDNPNMRARFRREASLSRRLNHPGILAALDYSFGREDLGEESFIVYPFVRGLTLLDFLKRVEVHKRTLTAEQALAIMWDITDILMVLEEARVLHRDLKPDNFMLSPGHINNIVLLDFGLSSDPNDPIKLTGEKVILGKMDFAAPELKNKGSMVANIISEIFALGVVLIVMFDPSLKRFERDCDYMGFASNPIATPLTDDVKDKLPPQLIPLVERMVDHLPGNRFAHFWQIQRACEYLLYDLCCR